ncbi:MAG: hypothetical protein QM571_00140 [Micrococcaceae bacterium]
MARVDHFYHGKNEGSPIGCLLLLFAPLIFFGATENGQNTTNNTQESNNSAVSGAKGDEKGANKHEFKSACPGMIFLGPDTFNNGYFSFTVPADWTVNMSMGDKVVLKNPLGKTFNLEIDPEKKGTNLDMPSSCSYKNPYRTLEFSDTLKELGNPNGYPEVSTTDASPNLSPRAVMRDVEGGAVRTIDISATDHKMGPDGVSFCSSDPDSTSSIRTSEGRIKFYADPNDYPFVNNQAEADNLHQQLMSDGTYSQFVEIANSIKLGDDPSHNPRE